MTHLQEEDDLAMVLAMHINKKPKHGGSVFGRQKLWRERIDADNRLMMNYFAQIPIYPESYFRRRFRISIKLFKHIAEKLASHDRVFQQRRNVVGELGHSTFQKVTAAPRTQSVVRLWVGRKFGGIGSIPTTD